MKLIEAINLDSIIDQNINLIDEGRFEEFYDICKKQLKRKDLILLTDMLSEEGIDLPYSITGFLYGIKTKDSTLSLRAPTSPTQYGASFTSNAGMKGGHQIGFESRKAAQDYADTLANWTKISIILPETVSTYTWKQIEIPGGYKAFATTAAINSFKPYMDPDQKKNDRLKTRYNNEIKKLEKELQNPEQAEDIRKLTAEQNTRTASEIKQKIIDYIEHINQEYVENIADVKRDISLLNIDSAINYCTVSLRDNIRLLFYIKFNNHDYVHDFEQGLNKVFPDKDFTIQVDSYTYANEESIIHTRAAVQTPYFVDVTSPEAIKIIDKKQQKLDQLKQKLANL